MAGIINAWKDAYSEAIYLEEDAAHEECLEVLDGYVIQDNDGVLLFKFFEDYFEAEREMCERNGGVSIGPDYIAIYDQGEEICYWQEAEWLAEPELAINLANAIRIYYTKGPQYMREILNK